MTSHTVTAFFEAIEDGDIRALRRLLVATPSLVHETDGYGFTPLMRAVASMGRTPQVVGVLIEAGADVNARTDEAYTALHLMIDVNGPTGTGVMPGEIARRLTRAGADVEAVQHWGWTPLMCAAVEGTPDELRALVDVGGDVNRQFPADTLPAFLSGRTTLMAAIGDPEKVRILLDAGVNRQATDAHGQTALDYARHCLAGIDGDGTDASDYGTRLRQTITLLGEALA